MNSLSTVYVGVGIMQMQASHMHLATAPCFSWLLQMMQLWGRQCSNVYSSQDLARRQMLCVAGSMTGIEAMSLCCRDLWHDLLQTLQGGSCSIA